MTKLPEEGSTNNNGDVYTCTYVSGSSATVSVTNSNQTVNRTVGGEGDRLGNSALNKSVVEKDDFGATLQFTAGSQGARIAVSDIKVKFYYTLDQSYSEGLSGPQPDSFRSVVTSPTSDVRIIVGNEGVIYRSTDLGVSWSLIETNFTEDLLDVSYFDNSFVATGRSGLILISTDEGLTWNKKESQQRASYYTAVYLGASKGWLFMGNEKIESLTPDFLTWNHRIP